jgi:ligand-binding sensor domain-containing protein/serine phosphatase RsbU (regulator of sigma subunit)
MNHYRRIFYLLFIISSFFSDLSAQTISFKRFEVEQGLIHPSIYTINQDKQGFLWIGTGAGACRFDGIKFVKPTIAPSDSLTDAYTSCSFRSKEGVLWLGYDDGSIFTVENFKFTRIFHKLDFSSIITCISELSDGTILASSQSNGMIAIKEKKIININLNESKLIYAIQEIDQNRLLVGCIDGLWIAHKSGSNSYTYVKKITEIPSSRINFIIPQKNVKGFWIGTNDNGLFQLSIYPDISVKPFRPIPQIGNINTQWLLEDNFNNIWLCTFGNGVYKFEYDSSSKQYKSFINYNENNGLGDNYIKYAYQDHEGNIWFGTYSNGLSAILDEAFTFFKFKKEGLSNDILSIQYTNNGYWLGSRKVLYFLKKNESEPQVFSSKNGLPADAITALSLSDNNTLWIGTDHSGIYRMDTKSNSIKKYFYSQNSVENKINQLKFAEGTLWAATNGGLFAFNINSGKQNKYSTDTELPHNKINDVFIDSRADVWIATKGLGLYSVKSQRQIKIEGTSEIEFTAISEDLQGNLWATTYGDGLFGFLKDSIIHLTEKNGLKSDYGYSLLTDKEGNLWIGHRLSISKIQTSPVRAISYGTEIGILGDCNLHATSIDNIGNISFGTTDGIIIYNAISQKQQKKLPPIVNITAIKINDKDYDLDKPIVLPYGKYRVRIEFIGIHYRSPKSVKYQYKLEGWESEWSELSENNFAYYPRLEDGKYKFLIRAINEEGLSNEIPVEFDLTITPPLWKRWWFILLCGLTIIGSFILYLWYRDRKHKRFQEYLQKLLDERTQEVLQQKEEIEMKNRDITDSITYAQRIQNSILPSIKKLQDSFSGSFIFYQPRDIVSGDFYWFDNISDTKFVIVCGDSTGHGVPGALMSMIGTTLIKDICNRPDVIKPSDILNKLDEEIRSTLNQNFDYAESSDGMDLIACEIDLQTYQVTISSAMRPVILYKNGQQIYVTGSKSSIGGIMYINESKYFENKTYQLGRGDIIYMFSDGYPDQFGGPSGKKYKMVRLRNFLDDIYELPMEEQFYQIKNNFNLWKGQYEQIDDVLFMGIRL